MNVDFPLQFGSQNRTAKAETDKHIRNLIEQVLFTVPGERVNRPTFGCGLMQTIFQPNSDELAAAAQFMVQESLQKWLGDLIQVERVQTSVEDGSLHVMVAYIVRRTMERRTEKFTREG
jgi:phage baseplate assembly protein W